MSKHTIENFSIRDHRGEEIATAPDFRKAIAQARIISNARNEFVAIYKQTINLQYHSNIYPSQRKDID